LLAAELSAQFVGAADKVGPLVVAEAPGDQAPLDPRQFGLERRALPLRLLDRAAGIVAADRCGRQLAVGLLDRRDAVAAEPLGEIGREQQVEAGGDLAFARLVVAHAGDLAACRA